MKKLTVLFAFLTFLGFQVLQAQAQEISGTITSSETGEGVPGVTVLVRGTTIGTITDIDGTYTINVPEDTEQTLMFTFIGMKTQEIPIGDQTIIDVVLEPDVFGLDEVIVTAIGIKRERREITYQTQKIVGEDIVAVAPTRIASALAGKIAGLQINVQDHGVNPSTQILLRGLRSISANNSALIVIDGSISSSCAFDDLNPNDIGDISVLKGATAAALYGSAAGNGALIVTTKTGKGADKFTVGINSSYTMEKVAYMPDFQTEYGTGWGGLYDNIENCNWGPRFDGQLRQIGPTMPEGYVLETQMVPYAPVKNNLLDFYETGNTMTNTVYVTGSTEDSKYYVSFGDQRADGIVMDDTYERNTLRVNASKKIGNVELGINASYFTDKTNVTGDQIGDQDRTLYWFVLNQSANIPLSSYKDWDNPASYGYADNYYNAYYQNPYWAVGTNRDMDETNRIVGNFNLSWDIMEWLNFTGRVSVNNNWGTGKNWRAYQEYDPDLQPWHSTVDSFVEDTEFQSDTYSSDALLTGNFAFYDSFTLKAILGGTNQSDTYRNSFMKASNLSIPGFYDISNGTGIIETTVDQYEKRNYGFFGDFTLGYNNYLFLNFSGRNDWTSTLNKENRSYFYPAVGLSFVATDAFEILKTGDILTSAKITASNATVFNDLTPYRVSETYSQSGAYPYGNINGFYLTTTAIDSEIKKEKLNTTEIGLNLGFLNGKIWLDFSWFNTITSDLITNTTPSISSGATSFLTNIGELESNGIEFSLGGTLLNVKDFNWNLTLNYAASETVVNEIYEGLDEIAIRTTGQWGIYAVVGESFPQMKANVYDRDPQGRIIVDPSSGYPETKDGLYSLGRTTPDYIVGLSSIMSFKGFSVSGTLDYRTGHVYYEQGSDAMEFTGISMASVSSNRQDFVIPNSLI